MSTLFLRLLAHDDKPAALADAIEHIRDGQPSPDVFTVEPESFRQVPGAPFAYWVSERVRGLFEELVPFESEGRSIRVGLQTSDDFRFIRTWWEVGTNRILDSGANGPNWRENTHVFQSWCRERTFLGKRWVPFAKGGSFSPFFDEPQMVVNWERDGEEMKRWTESLYDGTSWSRNIRNTDYYFRPGVTWPLRGVRYSAQAVPAGSCFSIAGKLATSDQSEELLTLLALMNCVPFDYLIGLFAGKVGGVQYEVGLIAKIPIPTGFVAAGISDLAGPASLGKAALATSNETSHVFHLPALLQVPGATLAERVVAWREREAETERRLAEIQSEIDDIAFRLYGIDGEDRRMMEAGTGAGESSDADEEDESEDDS